MIYIYSIIHIYIWYIYIYVYSVYYIYTVYIIYCYDYIYIYGYTHLYVNISRCIHISSSNISTHVGWLDNLVFGSFFPERSQGGGTALRKQTLGTAVPGHWGAHGPCGFGCENCGVSNHNHAGYGRFLWDSLQKSSLGSPQTKWRLRAGRIICKTW